MSLLQDRHVLILGLGLSGLAMARWCAAQGASVTVADTRAAPPQLEALRAQVPAARFVAGPMDAALVDDASLRAVYRSPGLAPAAISSVVNAARERGLPVSGELGLFAQALADLKAQRGYAPAVLAITGTNGKTTVTALTGQLVERAGLSVVVAGNIGPTLLETLQAHLADDSLPQAWVLELSSFQLDGSDDFEPTAATVLNVTQDHLDWHGDMAAYAAAKARIFGERAVMVLNRNDDAVMAMRPAAPAKLPKGAPRPVPRSVVSFGADMPARLLPDTPQRATTRKGQVRIAMEQALADAAAHRGVQSVVIRAGEFIGGGVGNWFDNTITKSIGKGRLTYPGRGDVAHAWAYLPDLARAFVAVAAVRANLPAHLLLHFPGYTLTGDELCAALGRVAGRPLRVGGMPWPLLRAISPLVPILREITEMRYLWEVPHALDGSALQAMIGETPVTPLDDALRAALHELGFLHG